MLDVELAVDEDHESDGGDDGTGDDEAGAEPIVFLAFVEHGLESADGDDEQAEAPVVDSLFAFADRGQVGRIFDDAVGEVEGDDADGNVDEEDPAPTVVVDDPAADGGTENGREDDGHSVDGEGHGAFLGREGVGEDGLLAGLEAAAGCALQDAEEDEDAEGGRESAKQGSGGEEQHAGHVETLAADAVGDPAADGEDDGVGYQVAGEHPSGFVAASGERAADVGHGHIGDGGIEGLHEGGQGDGDSNDPRVGARTPGFVEGRCGGRCQFIVPFYVNQVDLSAKSGGIVFQSGSRDGYLIEVLRGSLFQSKGLGPGSKVGGQSSRRLGEFHCSLRTVLDAALRDAKIRSHPSPDCAALHPGLFSTLPPGVREEFWLRRPGVRSLSRCASLFSYDCAGLEATVGLCHAEELCEAMEFRPRPLAQ